MLTVTACDRYGALRARASDEMSCPGDRLEVESVGAGGYRVEGCGRVMRYSCVSRVIGSPVCVTDNTSGGSSSAASAEARSEPRPSRIPPWSDDAVRVLLRGVHEPVLACFADDHPPFSVRITLNELGRVTYSRVLDGEPTDDERRCVTLLFGRVHIDGRSSRPRTVMLRFARGAGDEPITDAEATADDEGDATSTTAEEPATDPGGRARTLLDARAAAILACVEEDAIGLSVAWTADGVVTVSLRGARAGTPEEECVRAAVGVLRLDPAPGSAGSVIHAVTH